MKGSERKIKNPLLGVHYREVMEMGKTVVVRRSSVVQTTPQFNPYLREPRSRRGGKRVRGERGMCLFSGRIAHTYRPD